MSQGHPTQEDDSIISQVVESKDDEKASEVYVDNQTNTTTENFKMVDEDGTDSNTCMGVLVQPLQEGFLINSTSCCTAMDDEQNIALEDENTKQPTHDINSSTDALIENLVIGHQVEGSANSATSPTTTTTTTIASTNPHQGALKKDRERISRQSSGSNVHSVSSTVTTLADFDTKTMLTTLKNASNVNYVETMNWKKGWKGLKNKKYVWTYLTLCGFVGGVIIYTHDLIIKYMFQGRLTMINAFDPVNYFGLRLFLWIIYNLFFVYISLLLTIFIAPTAEGSGIPPIKAILNGAPLEDPLSLKTFIVKIIALPAVLGTGMFFGKVGPSAHIGAMITSLTMKIPIFKPIAKIKTLKNQMIACGCALGVGSNFSTPGGGVLFALEVMGTYYSLRGYLKSFYVAVVAAFTSRLFNSAVNVNLNFALNWNFKLTYPSFSIPELIAFAILGFIMGFVGIIFVFLNDKILRLRDRFGKHYLLFKSERLAKYKFMMIFENRVYWTIFICIVTSILTFPNMIGKYMSLTVGGTLEDLVSPKPLTADNGWITNSASDVFVSLAIFTLIRFIVSIFTINLPLPGGIYVPLVVIGAGFGRLFGEVVAVIFPNGFVAGQPIYAGAYAVVGIVSLTASATHAFSTVFIFLEIVGVAVYLPSLMAALIAVRISRFCYNNIYDSIIKLRGWPALLESMTDSEDLKVTNIMTSVDKMDILEERMTLNEVEQLLSKKKLPKILPVVSSKDNLVLLGQVYLKSLEAQFKLLKTRLEHSANPQVEEIKSNFVSFADEGNADSSNENSHNPAHVELREKDNSDTIDIAYETCEITISESQSAQRAHMLFSQMGLDEAFVVWKGRLMGQLARIMLINTVAARKRTQIVI